MSTRDEFDDLVTARLRAAAPQEAPAHLMDFIIDRVSATPQRGRGPFAWLGSPGLRLASAAVVLAAAVIAGIQFGGLFDRQTGADPSPSSSASAAPSGTSPSASGSEAPSSPPSPSVAPSDAAAAEELVLRVKFGGGTFFGPDLMPEFALMADGTVVWLPLQTSVENPPTLVTRQLTGDGLAELRELIFARGYLDESATYELEPRPDAGDPPGHGVGIYTFTAESADGEPVVVTSVQWLGDAEESAYYQPAPEREALDALAQQLRDPESLLDADAWAGPARGYEAPDYLLVLRLTPNVSPFNGTDASEIRWPFDGPLDAFGEEAGQVIGARCALVTGDAAGAIVADLQDAGGLAGMAMASSASLDWAEGNGTVDVFLIPRMPDGFPTCEDVP